MLSSSRIVGFVATTQPAEARRFYEQVLGLRLVDDSPFALVFAAGENTLRVQKVQALATPPYTSLGWDVADIAATVAQLASRGVRFQRYEGLPQDESGIWKTPDGAQVAWFRDPDGNTLSLSQHVAK